jgi:preprotein translocase SecF subunit
MKIVEKSKIWFSLSLAVMLIGLVIGITSGLNYGNDFTGGTMMQIDLGQRIEVEEVKEVLKEFNLNEEIVHAGVEQNEVIIKTKESLPNEERVAIFEVFQTKYNLTDEQNLGAEQFSPSIGKEIKTRAMISIIIAAIGMLIYITFRFEWVYGVSSIIALIHDVLILVAVYSIFRIPVNSSFIAAVLTIVGYSINDTIVVFDRIRENIKLKKKGSYADIANMSIRMTLVRSVNTSLTTALVIGSLYVFGVESIKEFALPLFAGVMVGTYSSIFIASPIWALIKDKIAMDEKHYNAAS